MEIKEATHRIDPRDRPPYVLLTGEEKLRGGRLISIRTNFHFSGDFLGKCSFAFLPIVHFGKAACA